MKRWILFCLLGTISTFWGCWAVASSDPVVFVTLLARNKGHTLPYFLHLLEQLDYPKDKLILWIVSDSNQDHTLHILNKWIPSVQNSYHSVFQRLVPSDDQGGPLQLQWTPERFRHVMGLKEEALEKARSLSVDYIWFLDCDVFLTNKKTLNILRALNKHKAARKKHGIIAPMLESVHMDSNFWLGQIEYNYRETNQHNSQRSIKERNAVGCHRAVMVHSCFWIDLKQSASRHLTFKSEKIPADQRPMDDIIVLAVSAANHKISMFVCNHEIYGYQMDMSFGGQNTDYDAEELLDVQLKVLDHFPPMEAHPLLAGYVHCPARDKLGFDDIYVINLERRPERRRRVEWIFRLMGVDFKLFNAVDGRSLNDSWLISSGIRLYPNYSEPNHKIPMTRGEIGCFLGHFLIWQEIVDRKLQKTLILEDDFRPEPRFKQRFSHLMSEVDRLQLDWDLLYLGRKKMQGQSDRRVKGTDCIVQPGFSYWTVAYALSYKGALKLLQNKPLERILPVDEYFSIMFNQRPGERWAEAIPNRNLKAYAAEPALIRPYSFSGQPGHVTDTTTTDIVPQAIIGQPLNDTEEKTVLFIKSQLSGRIDGVNIDKPSRIEL